MRIINMDVDSRGDARGCHLGPLSDGLNAIFGYSGSGKSILLKWLRVVAEEQAGHGDLKNSPAWNPSIAPIAGVLEFQNKWPHR